MKLIIENGIVLDGDTGEMLAVLTEPHNKRFERTVECAAEAIPAIQAFVNNVNSGTLKPRSAVREFEKILNKYQ